MIIKNKARVILDIESEFNFCKRHYGRYQMQFKTMDKFPEWWDCIPYWNGAYQYLIKTSKIFPNDIKNENFKAEIKKDMVADIKSQSKITLGLDRMVKSQLENKVDLIDFQVQKRYVIEWLKKNM